MSHITLQIALPDEINMDTLVQCPAQFVKLIDGTYTAINAYIIGQLENLDGGPQVTDLRISHMVYHNSTLQGSFRLHFNLSRQFCCSDISASQNDYMDFTFMLAKQHIYATGSYMSWSVY